MPINDTLTLAQTIFKRSLKLMGNRFEISVVADEEDEGWANNCIDAAIYEIQRIERLLTTFSDNSQTYFINANAGIKPVEVDKEMFDIIQRAIKISDLTQGAFDITYGSMDKRFWNFDRSMKTLPDAKTAKKMARLINYKNIILDKEQATVFLKEKGMRIGFGSIGKGYATERAKYILKQNGVENGIVNAAGDLTTWGYQPNGKPWTIGAANSTSIHQLFSYLNITDMTIATSGNFEKFAMVDGINYSPAIDPETGMPVQGIKCTTIISPSAEIATALATPVMITGIKAGLDMVNKMKNIACIIIDEQYNIYTSKNINLALATIKK